MGEAGDKIENSNDLGVNAKRVNQTGRGIKSGKRVLVKEGNPLTEVRSGRIKGTQYSEQDFRSSASSSLWKEYFLDKKHITGVLLDNNMLVWFPWDKELTGRESSGLAREKYPDSKAVASFLFGEKALGMSVSDLAVKSETESFDSHLSSLVDYFGRSLDWPEGIKMSVFYADRKKGSFDGNMQEFLVSH